MSKFKVGDKVVRKPGTDNTVFKEYQGDCSYYTVKNVTNSGLWLQLQSDNITSRHILWDADCFELYQEPDDELPPVPKSTLYISSGGRRKLTVHRSFGVVQLNVRLRDASGYEDTLGYALDPDAALQLAHDLRRMAMDIKRKEKAQ